MEKAKQQKETSHGGGGRGWVGVLYTKGYTDTLWGLISIPVQPLVFSGISDLLMLMPPQHSLTSRAFAAGLMLSRPGDLCRLGGWEEGGGALWRSGATGRVKGSRRWYRNNREIPGYPAKGSEKAGGCFFRREG